MVQRHPSTPEQRAQWVTTMLAHAGEYGLVTELSREIGISRQTLYIWRATGAEALRQAFTPTVRVSVITPVLERQILTVLVAGHASDRGIQACLAALGQPGVSLGTITAVVGEAERRARVWLATHVPATSRALALDEIFGNDHQRAYLSVVDSQGGAVWAMEGPLEVDAESWTLVLWDLEDRGLRWDRVSTDGGRALQQACTAVMPHVPVQRDVWHVLHRCAQAQGRLDRWVAELVARTAGIERQAARLAAGKPLQGSRVMGRPLQADVAAHAADVATARRSASGLRFLTQELRRLLAVVVVDHRGVLDPMQRQDDLEALLALLLELATTAPPRQQTEVVALHTHVSRALPDLLHFVDRVAQVQEELRTLLPADRQALLAWAWLRRATLGWTSADLVEQVPVDWRPAARRLLATWDDAVRVSTAAERWHSILRPHLAVHRTLSTGMLALLAVWHNHRVFTRGIHRGQSPLHLAGMSDASTDWLVVLGYPPASPPKPSVACSTTQRELAPAA